jgi:organic radical activating enzyme
MTPAEVADAVRRFDCRNVVLTGGEPLLHQHDFACVMERLRAVDANFRFEVETNGTILPLEALDAFVDQYNVSPKTSNSGNAVRLRRKRGPLAFFASGPKATFKFVVADASDLDEIRELAKSFEIPPERIFLMPEGTSSDVLRERGAWLAELAQRHGFQFSDRLHIHLYGDRRGV